MMATLRERNFALLWWGGLISLAGDWLLRTALPFYVYDLTGSALATSVMFMVGTVPGLLLGPVAGVFVDRWDRRRTLVVANLLLALTLTPLLLVRSADWLWLVYAVALVQSALVRFVVPAENALLPLLVAE
jgi:MFS family permease